MKSQRHLERRESLAYWHASQQHTGKLVGLVTELTDEGVNIHSRQSFMKGQTLSIKVNLDLELCGKDEILIRIKNVWCRRSEMSGIYHAGFEILKISDDDREAIRKLLESFSYLVPPYEEALGLPEGSIRM